MWDETDGLYYDKLITPDGTEVPVKVRSMVGIIPLLAAVIVDEERDRPVRDRRQAVRPAARRPGPRRRRRSSPSAGLLRGEPGDRRLLLGVVGIDRLRRLFEKLFDEAEFLSPYGLRAAVGLPPRPPLRARRRGHHGDDRLRAGRVDDGDVRRQLQLARAAVDPAQLPRRQRARALLPVLRRRLRGRVPDRQRHDADARQDRRRPPRAARLAVPRRRRRAAAVVRRWSSASSRTRPGRTTSSSTSTSTATTAPGSAPRTRPAGPASSPTSSAAARATACTPSASSRRCCAERAGKR